MAEWALVLSGLWNKVLLACVVAFQGSEVECLGWGAVAMGADLEKSWEFVKKNTELEGGV